MGAMRRGRPASGGGGGGGGGAALAPAPGPASDLAFAPESEPERDEGPLAGVEPLFAGALDEAAALLGFVAGPEVDETVGGSSAGPLSDSEVDAALRYHRDQPWKYTPEVIADIQGAVGATPTGAIDEDTVQRVAKRQAEVNETRRPSPPLVVDGKAGPRTLPVLEPVGLAGQSQIDAYVDAVKGERDELSAADRETRRERLTALVNARLEAVGVPPVDTRFAVGDDGEVTNDAANEFIHTTDRWEVLLKADALDDIDQGAALLYHEARHAEQHFMSCRVRAGELQNLSRTDRAVSIAVKLAVPLERVAEPAADAPIAWGTTERAEALGWSEDEPGRTFGGSSAEARALFEGIGAFLRGERTRESLEPLFDAYVRANRFGYRDRPDEWDAFFVSDQVLDGLGAERPPEADLGTVIAAVAEQLGLPVPAQ